MKHKEADKNTKAVIDPLDQEGGDPGFWKKSLVYFTLGLLWVISFFSLLLIPVVIFIGSKHSYVGERVESSSWIFFIILLILYTFITSIYLSIRGYQARYKLLLIFNILMLLGFIMTSIMQYLLLFYN